MLFKKPIPPFRLLALFVLLFLLAAIASGCETTPGQPVTVEVPVPVACKTPEPAVPDWETDKLTASSTTFEKVRAALVELHQHSAYELDLVAALRSCQ